MTLHDEIMNMGQQAVAAAHELIQLNSRKKNAILQSIADELESQRSRVQEENRKDLAAAEEAGLSAAMIDRLRLTPGRIDGMIKGIRDVAVLQDPVGSKISRWLRPNGLEIVKRRVPIGVIAIIYESRPNVTVDTAALCLKTSNAILLRGGKEAAHSNRVLADVMIEGGRKKGMPEGAIQLVRTTDRDAVKELVQLEGMVDMAIPRGGESLIRAVTELARVPVLKHYKGVCHTYVDAEADLECALAITENAKCQRPGVCNAMETLLVHADIAPDFLPRFEERMKARGVELRGDPKTCAILPAIREATDDDWYEEYLDMILAVKIVSSVDEAIAHINTYGSHHSDAVVTTSKSVEKQFLLEVDSATVYVNASTRFTDGAEFGMGAEIGISTDKLHARGPMGLEELTTYKYVILGKGQIRE